MDLVFPGRSAGSGTGVSPTHRDSVGGGGGDGGDGGGGGDRGEGDPGAPLWSESVGVVWSGRPGEAQMRVWLVVGSRPTDQTARQVSAVRGGGSGGGAAGSGTEAAAGRRMVPTAGGDWYRSHRMHDATKCSIACSALLHRCPTVEHPGVRTTAALVQGGTAPIRLRYAVGPDQFKRFPGDAAEHARECVVGAWWPCEEATNKSCRKHQLCTWYCNQVPFFYSLRSRKQDSELKKYILQKCIYNIYLYSYMEMRPTTEQDRLTSLRPKQNVRLKRGAQNGGAAGVAEADQQHP